MRPGPGPRRSAGSVGMSAGPWPRVGCSCPTAYSSTTRTTTRKAVMGSREAGWALPVHGSCYYVADGASQKGALRPRQWGRSMGLVSLGYFKPIEAASASLTFYSACLPAPLCTTQAAALVPVCIFDAISYPVVRYRPCANLPTVCTFRCAHQDAHERAPPQPVRAHHLCH